MRFIAYLGAVLSVVLFSESSDIVPQAIPFGDTIMRGGALGILTWACWYLMARELPRHRKGFTESLDKICERHERWENIRHEDSQDLRSAIDSLRVNCATARQEFQQQSEPETK